MAQQRLEFRYLNRCDVYMVIWMLYRLQGIVYSYGRLNQLLQMVMILWGLVIAVRYILLFRQSPPLLNATTWLVFMYTAYGVVYMLLGRQMIVVENSYTVAKYLYLQDSLKSLLPIYIFYHYSRTGLLTDGRLKLYFIVFLIISIANFNQFQEMMVAQDIWGRTEFTNNVAYSFLALFPMICLFYKKPFLQYAFAALLMLYIIMGMKRGAIAIGALCFAYFIWQNLRTTKSKKLKIVILLLSVALIGVAIWYVSYMLSTSGYFVDRIQSTKAGNSSGRDEIYGSLLYEIRYNFSVVEILFGKGANATIELVGNYAHQDWLETMCNNGVLGIVLLLIFYGRFLAIALKSRKLLNPMYSTAFMTLFIICIFKTMFSMSIQSMNLCNTMLIGYLLWKVNENKNVIQKDETASLY